MRTVGALVAGMFVGLLPAVVLDGSVWFAGLGAVAGVLAERRFAPRTE